MVQLREEEGHSSSPIKMMIRIEVRLIPFSGLSLFYFIEANRKHIQKLSDEFLTALKSEYKLNGINRYEGIHSLSFKNANGETLLHRLDLKGISISTGSACDSVNTQISHVLNAIKLDEEYAIGTIRVSFGKDNTVEEAVAVAKAIDSILMK